MDKADVWVTVGIYQDHSMLFKVSKNPVDYYDIDTTVRKLSQNQHCFVITYQADQFSRQNVLECLRTRHDFTQRNIT